MTETLHIRLLGDFSLVYGSAPLDTFHKPRLQALLAYLVLHHAAPQFRYHLASQLWPDSAEDQAHTNLRNLVFHLRQALPQADAFLRADSQTLQWVEGAPYTLDVLAFTGALEAGAPETGVPECSLANLEKALACYRGDLLPSCYDGWINPERERLRQMFLSALDRAAAHLEEMRCYPAAIVHSRRLVEADPLHPAGYARLVRLYALAGEAPAALKAYRDFARLLKKELGIEPDAETQAVYQRLVGAERKPQRVPGIALTAPEAPAPPPLVGRQAEWQAMLGLWKSASGGGARMLWLHGEAGIGKTRLAEELVQWAGRQGIGARVARSYPSEGRLPYGPVTSWLRAQRLPPLDKAWLVELARLLPELSKKRPPPLTEAWQRLRLFEALARAVLGAGQPQILLLEDLQWCDQDTLEWLHYLLRFDPRARLLVVGTVRSEEEPGNQALARLRAALAQEGLSLELELGRLNEDETGQLAALVAGKALSPGVGSLLYQETEGNPLFVVETMRAEMNKQARLPGVQPLPYKARAVLQNRIGQLSPGARELVGLAATIGREFSLPVLRQASGAGDEALVQGLDELVQRRIAREVAAGVYDFSHDKLREAALSELSLARAGLLHCRVAEALLVLQSQHAFLEDKNAEIAGHYERAGQCQAAFHYYQAAGQSARGIYANDLAIHYFQRALDLLAARRERAAEPAAPEPVVPSQEIAGLYEQLGDVLALASRHPQALAAYQSALAQKLPENNIWRASLYRRISVAQERQAQYSQAHASLDEAFAALGIDPMTGTLEECRAWIDLQFARVNFLYWEYRTDEMEQVLEQVRPYIDQSGRADQRIDFLVTQLDVERMRAGWRANARAVEIARQKLKLSQKSGTPYSVCEAVFHLGFSLLFANCLEEAGQVLEQAVSQAEKIHAMILLTRSLNYLSLCRRLQGRREVVRQVNERLFITARTIGEENYTGIAWGNRAWLAWLDGDFERAAECAQTAAAIWAKISKSTPFKWTALLPLLALAAPSGQVEEAKTYAQALLEPGNLALADPLPELLASFVQESDRETSLALLDQVVEAAKSIGYL